MLPKYKYLLTYRYAEIIYDLTFAFVKKYIDYKSRTKDQMEQAARSGKQNIVEGVEAGRTSKKSEIKLLGVSYASFEELIQDYEDFLRERVLEIYPKGRLLLTLCHMETYLLSKQIAASEKQFVEVGGFTENLYAKRVAFRESSKSPR